MFTVTLGLFLFPGLTWQTRTFSFWRTTSRPTHPTSDNHALTHHRSSAASKTSTNALASAHKSRNAPPPGALLQIVSLRHSFAISRYRSAKAARHVDESLHDALTARRATSARRSSLDTHLSRGAAADSDAAETLRGGPRRLGASAPHSHHSLLPLPTKDFTLYFACHGVRLPSKSQRARHSRGRYR